MEERKEEVVVDASTYFNNNNSEIYEWLAPFPTEETVGLKNNKLENWRE